VQIAITARHGTLSASTQAYIESKSAKLLRVFERLTRIEVTVDLGGDQPFVEMLVSAEHKHDFVGRDHNASVHAAFDQVLHKVEQQLRKYKERVQERHRTPARGSDLVVEEPESFGPGPQSGSSDIVR